MFPQLVWALQQRDGGAEGDPIDPPPAGGPLQGSEEGGQAAHAPPLDREGGGAPSQEDPLHRAAPSEEGALSASGWFGPVSAPSVPARPCLDAGQPAGLETPQGRAPQQAMMDMDGDDQNIGEVITSGVHDEWTEPSCLGRRPSLCG